LSVLCFCIFAGFIAAQGLTRSVGVLVMRPHLRQHSRAERLLSDPAIPSHKLLPNYVQTYSLLVCFLPLACLFSIAAHVLLAAFSFLHTTQDLCRIGQTIVFGLFMVHACLLIVSALVDMGNFACTGTLVLSALLVAVLFAAASHVALPAPDVDARLCWPPLGDVQSSFLLVPLVFFVIAALYIPCQIKHESSTDLQVAIWRYVTWLVLVVLFFPAQILLSLLSSDWSITYALLLVFTNTAVGSTLVALVLTAKRKMMRLQNTHKPQYQNVELVDLDTAENNRKSRVLSASSSALAPLDQVDGQDALDISTGSGGDALSSQSTQSKKQPTKAKQNATAAAMPTSVQIVTVDATDA
jgi:hypothetical protein